jgi:hypothetical protein
MMEVLRTFMKFAVTGMQQRVSQRRESEVRYDGADGGQKAFWTSYETAVSAPRVHDFDMPLGERSKTTHLYRMNVALRSVALFVSLAFVTYAVGLHEGYRIPAGTILPVRLNSTLSSAKKPGQIITARVMQDVPLPSGAAIRAGAKVIGRIVSVTSVSSGSTASLSLRFEALEMRDGKHSISTELRAIASFVAVERAQLPRGGSGGGGDPGTPETAWTTVQVGGDVVYRGGGYVEENGKRVGKPVPGGVLSRLRSNPERGCRTSDTSEAFRALWVFSSDACGVYELPNLQIRPSRPPHSAEEIILDSAKGQVRVRAGAGLLLMVNDSAPDSIR